MLALCVPAEELGKIYSVLAFVDGLLPFAVSEIYASIWIVSISLLSYLKQLGYKNVYWQ